MCWNWIAGMIPMPFAMYTPATNLWRRPQDAIDLLEPMTKDPVDFVRQGAFISLAMILAQQSDVSPSLSPTRALFAKIIAEKHEDPMARFGAVLAQGFLDAGRRTITISLQSHAGSKSMSASVGMTLFAQFWYWYPLAPCTSLAFALTVIIGITEELKVRRLNSWLRWMF
jgi:26S proteasome regulatory subunit N2